MTIPTPTPAPSRRPRVLVLGGSGFVGRALCERLTSPPPDLSTPAWQVRVPTRRAAMLRGLQTLPAVELLVARPIDQPQVLDRLVSGCDAVVNLVAILHGDEAAFEAVHVQWPRLVAQACQRQGVRRLVHVSALACSADAPSRYLRSKARGEAALQAEALDLSLLRPSVIFGAQDRFLNTFAALQTLAPVVPLASAAARFQPVWVDDVAEAVLRCLARPDTVGRVYEAVGPDVVSLADLVRLAGRCSGHPRPIWPLPEHLGRWQARLMALMPGEPLMSPDNLDSMRVPSVASGQCPTLADLGIAPSPLAAVAPGYLAPDVRCARLDRWRRRHA